MLSVVPVSLGREMTCWLRKLWKDESGTAAIEYPLLVALIAIGAIVVLFQLSGSLNKLFSAVAAQISPLAEIASPPPPPPDDDDD